MENKNEGFTYTYSASEQEEIKKIRSRYAPREQDKMERLRKLDNTATQRAQVVSIIFGIIGALTFGLGMSLVISELGAVLGMTSIVATLVGVIIGAVGGILSCLAYPMYNIVLKHEREKIAPEIIMLTDELMQ